MKKILSVFLVVALLACCIFAMASCNSGQGEKPELDLKKAAKALEKEDYSVTHTDDEDDLDVFVEERLTAHDEDYDEALTIIVFKDKKTAKLYFQKRYDEFKDEIKYYESQIEYYEHILEEYSNKLDSDEEDDLEDTIKDHKKDLEEMKEYCIGISGCTVWYGTADIIEDSK